MKSSAIYNKKSDTIKIDLVGEFGDGFWGEEITKEKIINLTNDHSTSDLIVNLSSLGGSVDTALAARDWISMHKGHTTVRLLGRNASASTFFSTGFDKVEISESGMFLIHNVWGAAVGGAEDFRKIADDFDKHNDIIVNLYRKKTGKSKNKIKDLMAEDKWIDATEAKDFGFADEIFEPKKKDNKFNIEQQSIYNKYLPEFKTNQMADNENGVVLKDEKGFFDRMKNILKPEIKDISEDTKKEFEASLLKASETEKELSDKIAELEKNENSEEMADKTKEIETLKNEVKELNTKLSAAVADGSEPKNKEDKEDSTKLSDNDKMFMEEVEKMSKY